MTEPVNEIRGEFHDVLAITELRGLYPNVPIDAGVDYAGLIAMDTRQGTEPVFITLPIGKANVTSGNKRHYDEAFLTELERQTLSLKPVGLMGHLSESERATAFPQEAVHWVGAARHGDTLWGKAYVVPGAVRDRIHLYKSQGKSIATSIDALCTGVWDESLKAHRMQASTLQLGQIDLAPSDRAGIKDLAAIPHLTTEMHTRTDVVEPAKESEPIMPEKGKLEYINEMSADDARLLPEPVRQAIVASVPTPPEVAQVQELRQALGVDDKADLKALVTEMRQIQETQRLATIRTRITELATSGIKLEAMRGMVTELVAARNPQTLQEAETAYQQVCEMASVKAALDSTVQTTMGPPQRTPVQPQSSGKKYFEIPVQTHKEA